MEYRERLNALCPISLQGWRKRFIVIMMWELLHELVPNDLIIQFRDSRWTDIKAVLPSNPRGSHSAVVTQYDPSFAFMGS